MCAILCADDAVFLVKNPNNVSEQVSARSMNLKMNISKAKVVVFDTDNGMKNCNLYTNGEKLAQVEENNVSQQTVN